MPTRRSILVLGATAALLTTALAPSSGSELPAAWGRPLSVGTRKLRADARPLRPGTR